MLLFVSGSSLLVHGFINLLRNIGVLAERPRRSEKMRHGGRRMNDASVFFDKPSSLRTAVRNSAGGADGPNRRRPDKGQPANFPRT
jgi:hypothetical protein